jgi:SH3-like domain-containing protein
MGLRIFTFVIFFSFALPAMTWAQAYCVKKKDTQLKAEPKYKSETTWTVGRYMPLQGTGKRKAKWVEVTDFKGRHHWVLRRQVSTGLKCLVIKRKTTKIRTGPGTKFPLADLGSVEREETFRDLSGEDGWNQIRNAKGEGGWVNLNHVWKPINHRYRLSFENEE